MNQRLTRRAAPIWVRTTRGASTNSDRGAVTLVRSRVARYRSSTTTGRSWWTTRSTSPGDAPATASATSIAEAGKDASCFVRLSRSCSTAATSTPSTTTAAAESWNPADTPMTSTVPRYGERPRPTTARAARRYARDCLRLG